LTSRRLGVARALGHVKGMRTLALCGALLAAAPAFAQSPDIDALQPTIAAHAADIATLRAAVSAKAAELARPAAAR